MKVKRFLFSIVIMLLSLCLEAQNHSTTIKVQAMDMGNAVISNDFNKFIRYMHPALISFAGGKEVMKIKMDSAYQMMKQFNVTFKRYWIGNPGEIAIYKNQLQAVLPQVTTLKTPLGELVVQNSLIVISIDNGNNWWFVDTNVYDVDKLRDILPDLSPAIKIPSRKKPQLMFIDN